MSNDQKVISITTIPLTKLTVVINNFIANTITHLNKLSVKGDEKLSEFDNKLNDLDAMTTLLEAKLNSLPEKITSTYPPLEPVTLPDVNPSIVPNPVPSAQDNSNQSSSSNTTGIVVGTGASVPPPPPPPPPPPFPCNGPPTQPVASPPQPVEHDGIKEEQKDGEEPKAEEGGGENLSPAEELENFLKENEPLRTLHKMIKVGVPTMQVSMKAKMSGEFDMDLVEILFEKEKKVNPNLS
jgi:hypothetical protein